ncbi:hypothetical protein HMPREF0758_4243 [Serratia odorifera DSM 4582]|uniref:Uncharacterized protein n=1 Tax=Serratia odorifera DSM 4582 TaxID=667129 RepID=D4E7U3_SEROD|nr:hypothetical protein HMPREF0758_4243 [Serratia odorifera DSM 4582]
MSQRNALLPVGRHPLEKCITIMNFCITFFIKLSSQKPYNTYD